MSEPSNPPLPNARAPTTPQAGLGGGAPLKSLPQLAVAMRDSDSDGEEWLQGPAEPKGQVGQEGGEEPPAAGGLQPAWGGT